MSEIAVRNSNTPTTHTTPSPVAAHGENAMRLVEWAEEAQAAHHLASALVRTPFAGSWKGDIDGATAAILKGSEVGLTPVTALGAFDNIQGTPAPKAITLRALVQAHGHDLEIVESDAQHAVARYRRNGQGEWRTATFTIEDAKSMNLTGKDNWKKQPENMLIARVTSKAARLVASDVILGIGYSAEEVRDESGWNGATRTPREAAQGTASDRMGALLGTTTTAQQVSDDPERFVDEAGDLKPAETGEVMTDKTRRELFALFGERGIDDRDEQIRGVVHIIGRPIESRSEITETEARAVIARLRGKGEQ